MCCQEDDDHQLPPAVVAMLAEYRRLSDERGWDWSGDLAAVAARFSGVASSFRYGWLTDPAQFAAAMRESTDGRLSDPAALILRAMRDPLPSGVAVAVAGSVHVREPLPFVLSGRPLAYVVVADDGTQTSIEDHHVTAEHPYLELGGRQITAAEPTPRGRLRLTSDAESRWSVVDARGGSWFPDGSLVKYDFHDRPFFYGNDLELQVPAGSVTITGARGCEFRARTVTIDVFEGCDTPIEIVLDRLYDAASRGWYGGDLHVHLNYLGDQVCAPEDAASMQRGEGLHVMNLAAANMETALVYDKAAFESYVGRDLPGASADKLARWGVEYRNDLFGHFHAFNPSGPPSRYQSGHPDSDEPQDWPPNATAAAEFRRLGATIGYTHPIVYGRLDTTESVAKAFADHRAHSTEAKGLVMDAALGLVDSLDLTGPHSLTGTEDLYHRLLGCGLRLAATAGTDTMLSLSRSSVFSNPPGWSRAYADIRDQPFTAASWQDAVRAGRTFATNGPWLELEVDGHAIGDVVSLDEERTLTIRGSMAGLGVERLEVCTSEGTLASVEVGVGEETAQVSAPLMVRQSTWVALVARGSSHPSVPGVEVYAHTSPTWVHLRDEPVARPDDARWCLTWLDQFEGLAQRQGNFTGDWQLDDLRQLIDQARAFYQSIADKGVACQTGRK